MKKDDAPLWFQFLIWIPLGAAGVMLLVTTVLLAFWMMRGAFRLVFGR